MRFVSLFPQPKNVPQTWAVVLTAGGLAGFLIGCVALLTGAQALTGLAWSAACVAFALRLRTTRAWQPFAFSCWVLAFVSTAMFFPVVFRSYWTFDVRQAWLGSNATVVEATGNEAAEEEEKKEAASLPASTWIKRDATKAVGPLIQVIMFGMGTTLGLADFMRVLSRPTAIAEGMVLQFGIMPFVGFALAMLAICLVIGIIVAQSRDQLLEVGLLLILVAALHNASGYALGYWGARSLGLKESVCRTIAIEVGMQNGGMATALATSVLKAPPAALAGAIFGPWMSISGSLLASWWGRKPVEA